jgi:very-short-patch-repair endonuclease
MKRKIKRLTIDDLLATDREDHFVVKQDKKTGKPKVIRKKKKEKQKTYQEQYPTFFSLLNQNPLIPKPVEEFMFHVKRRWRIDICWPEQKLAVEIEGGVWTKGSHVQPSGFEKDREKYNQLTMYGYSLLRFTPREVETCDAFDLIIQWFRNYEARRSSMLV